MSKVKSTYVCQSCGAQTSKWMGKCTTCGEWNTIEEEIISDSQPSIVSKVLEKNGQPENSVYLSDVEVGRIKRIISSDNELNRVLGGGIVPGSLVLVGGEPGIGKSTLLLQMALRTASMRFLYVSGEESGEQIKMRADRIGQDNHEVLLYSGTKVEDILAQTKKVSANFLIVDSIQTIRTALIDSAPGTITQIRECTHLLQQFAKQSNIPVFIIGHITKEGVIAGPKLLEHIVDVVLQFEGDSHYDNRILRSIKNRFGSIAELGIYEMHPNGLSEVENPSEILFTKRDEPVAGVAIASMVEGARAFIIEIQALVTSSVYGNPQRSATGFDTKRLNMLLAVLEKRCGFQIGDKDIFLNVAGGLKLKDTATDLAVLAALISSFNNHPLPLKVAFCGEVSLTGEIRPVNSIDLRINEVQKLGFEKIYCSKNVSSQWKGVSPVHNIADLVYQMRNM
ncbi:MAG: DNA repair protein RadA [Chitinophagales bacterium]